MSSIQKMLSGNVDRVRNSCGVRETGMDGCNFLSETPSLLPVCNEPSFASVVKEFDAYVEAVDVLSESYIESVALEDIAYSMESEASSKACSGDSLASDADSVAPGCVEKLLKRCASGSSSVTYDEAVSKFSGKGDSMMPGSRLNRELQQQWLKSKADDVPSSQEIRGNAASIIAESAGTAWTDDKHCSYLNSIEATFVRSLYEPEFRSVEMCTDSEQDCVESRPVESTHRRSEVFKSLQRGCYDQREYYRPQFLDIFVPSHAGVFASPWIQHFNPKLNVPSFNGVGAACNGTHAFAAVSERDFDVVGERKPVTPSLRDGPQVWYSRLQSQLNASTSTHFRLERATTSNKRSCNVELSSEVLFRPKKLKSSQQNLAQMDLKMEEQFVLGQSGQNTGGNCIDGNNAMDENPRDVAKNKLKTKDMAGEVLRNGRSPENIADRSSCKEASDYWDPSSSQAYQTSSGPGFPNFHCISGKTVSATLSVAEKVQPL